MRQIDLYELGGEARSQCPYCMQVSMYKMDRDTLSIKIACAHLMGIQRNIDGDCCHALYARERKLIKKI